MSLRLYDFAPSPFCLKVRAILDYKGIPYERVSVIGPAWLEVRRRGGIGQVPALEMDGTLICDSTDIAHALERRFPEPAIVPASARERALCHALEDWADESLYFIGLYHQWWDPRGHAMVPMAFGRSVIGRAAAAFYSRRNRQRLWGQGIARKSVEHVRADLTRALDAAADLLSAGRFLLGDRPFLCDFAVGAELVYLHFSRRCPEARRLHRLGIWRLRRLLDSRSR